ncbi:MAG: 2-amino-4-hydroxy-6-hydroxymethyldihydropteridine diphosphokinase [Flavobacteriales bacterium]
MAVENDVLFLLGGNLGDPPTTLTAAENLLSKRAGQPISRSRDHWTEPWGFTDPHLFLNRALLVRTKLDPASLLAVALGIEHELGRERTNSGGYASRTIDIDILLFGDLVLSSPTLTLPHPRMHERWFALAPSADIVPSWQHPLLGRTILELLNDLRTPR